MTTEELSRAELVALLRDASERMRRARGILTQDNPRPECNWGVLSTEDIDAALAKETSKKRQKTFRIDYDDSPDEAVDSINGIIESYGIKFVMLEGKPSDSFVIYQLAEIEKKPKE